MRRLVWAVLWVIGCGGGEARMIDAGVVADLSPPPEIVVVEPVDAAFDMTSTPSTPSSPSNDFIAGIDGRWVGRCHADPSLGYVRRTLRVANRGSNNITLHTITLTFDPQDGLCALPFMRIDRVEEATLSMDPKLAAGSVFVRNRTSVKVTAVSRSGEEVMEKSAFCGESSWPVATAKDVTTRTCRGLPASPVVLDLMHAGASELKLTDDTFVRAADELDGMAFWSPGGVYFRTFSQGRIMTITCELCAFASVNTRIIYSYKMGAPDAAGVRDVDLEMGELHLQPTTAFSAMRMSDDDACTIKEWPIGKIQGVQGLRCDEELYQDASMPQKRYDRIKIDGDKLFTGMHWRNGKTRPTTANIEFKRVFE